MSAEDLFYFSGLFGTTPSVFLGVLAAIALWSILWKGLALWSAARGNQKAWFVILIVINTLGILEIIYLLFFAKKK